LAGAAVIVLPPGVYSYLALPGQGVAVIVGLYVAAAMVRAAPRSRVDARVLLAGMLAVLAGLAVDLLLIDMPGRPDRKFAQFGFALFLLSPAVVIARRLSEALNAEERGRTLEENARLREDVERISRHDLKTPLNSILTASRLLGDDDRLTGDQQELVSVLQGAGLRMLEMVNLSLGLFKMETGTYQLRAHPVDLREVVSRVMVDLHAYADANEVTLHWQDSDPTPVHVRAEELLCYSILANVVKNAIEAGGSGNLVTISVRRGDPVALCVHNPGAVPAEIAAHFFEKYVTGYKSGGTGLGTYSARMMARAQHGELAMETGKDGTTLTLTLPPSKEAPPPRLVPSVTHGPQSQWLRNMPARHVLLVDDDEFIRLVNRRLLPSPPFTVETAANGQAGIEAMSRRWPDYLLIDMEMPVRNGIDTVRWVREQEEVLGRPRCHIVMMSGNDEEASVQRALDAGADRFLVKPVSRERLLSAVRELEFGGLEAETQPPPVLAQPPEPPGENKVFVEREWEEVFPEFLRLQRESVDGMARALAADAREDLHFLAHRAYGGLAAMGLDWAARQSRILERDALHAAADALLPRIQALREHLATVQVEYR
jgi:two-component system, sensor histidine kinase ChiS